MNLILFDSEEQGKTIPLRDRRVRHILEVLRLEAGDRFEAGIVNGPLGTAKIVSLDGNGLAFEPDFGITPEPLFPVTLLIGFPRPIFVRRILKDLTTLGVRAIRFLGTEKGEKSYRDSTIWKGEYLQYVREGAEQAHTTLLPEVSFFWNLRSAIGTLGGDERKIALDTADPECRLSEIGPVGEGCVLAIGSERGWSDSERDLLRSSGFTTAGLGRRVLRTETACLSGVTLVLAAMGVM